jgi:hypothetical protein
MVTPLLITTEAGTITDFRHQLSHFGKVESSLTNQTELLEICKNEGLTIVDYINSGYDFNTYLVQKGEQRFALKIPHHLYYQNSVGTQINAIHTLKEKTFTHFKVEINYTTDSKKSFLLMPYIEGKSIANLIAEKQLDSKTTEKLRMAYSEVLKTSTQGFMIDFTPENLILNHDQLILIDPSPRNGLIANNFEDWLKIRSKRIFQNQISRHRCLQPVRQILRLISPK